MVPPFVLITLRPILIYAPSLNDTSNAATIADSLMRLARNTNVLIEQYCPSYLLTLFAVIYKYTCYLELHNFLLWRPFWQRLFILGAAVKLNMTQLKKNGFTIIFVSPRKH